MKRAFVDITLELLAELLNLKEDVAVIHAEPRPELGTILRLHFRGDGLPDMTHCMELEPSHRLGNLGDVQLPYVTAVDHSGQIRTKKTESNGQQSTDTTTNQPAACEAQPATAPATKEESPAEKLPLSPALAYAKHAITIPYDRRPGLANALARVMVMRLGASEHAYLVAYANYAQVLEKLECTEKEFQVQPADRKWLEENKKLEDAKATGGPAPRVKDPDKEFWKDARV